MSDVLVMAGVGVVRGDTVILEDVSRDVEEEGQRWSRWAPTVPARRRCSGTASARIRPDDGCRGHPR